MRSNFLTAAIILLSICWVACNGAKKAAIPAEGAVKTEGLYREWKLTEVQGHAVGENSKANLVFTEGEVNKIAGNSGCNRMMGFFQLSGADSIKLSPVAGTKMACLDDNLTDMETKYLDALSKTTSWSISNNELLLKDGGVVLAKLKGQKQLTPEEGKLNGSWELNYISGPKIAFNGLFPDKKPILTFELPKAEVSGNGGCNGYSAKVAVNGSKISFGDALSTMMACEGNGEPVYFKTLKTVTSYTITDGKTLNLIMDDVPVLRFTRK